ncbi:MAG: PEP-CTERM sorting domain-containing protein [Verrucomicrobiota bacterium]|nr:PEP-CTERM sorting domain-containing protein [Verrucomicrobiota bacterium]
MNNSKIILIALALCPCPILINAAVIISDTFTTTPGALSGRAPETAQTIGDLWAIDNSDTGNLTVANGTMNLGVNGSYSKAILPFNDVSVTDTFTLSFDISFTPVSAAPVFYAGFGNAAGNGSAFSDNSLGLGFQGSFNNTDTSVTINALSGETRGWGTIYASTSLTRATTSDAYVANLKVTYNPVTDQAEFFVNGLSIVSGTYTDELGGLWFKTDHMDANAPVMVDNLTLTTVPEPSVYAAIAGIATMAMAIIRRRNK